MRLSQTACTGSTVEKSVVRLWSHITNDYEWCTDDRFFTKSTCRSAVDFGTAKTCGCRACVNCICGSVWRISVICAQDLVFWLLSCRRLNFSFVTHEKICWETVFSYCAAVMTIGICAPNMKTVINTACVVILGFDMQLWRQAIHDNPDPQHLVPYPIRGFEQLRKRQELQVNGLSNFKFDNSVSNHIRYQILKQHMF